MKIKLFKSIDGLFNKNLNFKSLKKFKNLNLKKISLLGHGNSISGIPYCKQSILLKINTKKEIFFDKKNKFIEVTGNYEAYAVHNYLQKKNFFFPSFPSYPNVTIGACIANCTHGISPKYGVISDFVKEIKLFNPNFGYKTLSNNKNKKIFDLTIGGMGLTGIIVSAKLRVFKLNSTFIKIKENKKFLNINDVYNFLKKKNIYITKIIYFLIQIKKHLLSREFLQEILLKMKKYIKN